MMTTQTQTQTDTNAAGAKIGSGADRATAAVTAPTTASATVPTTPAEQPVNLTGRSVFVVETTNQGVMVRSAFMTEDKRLLDMPAIFPELTYALNVVEDLKRQITEQFAQAAQVGARVIAEQVRVQQSAAQPAASAAPAPAEPTSPASATAAASSTGNASSQTDKYANK